MFPAIASLTALLAAIVIGCWRRINIGILSIAFAFLVGHLLIDLTPAGIITGWPLNLFFMLLGITLLFGIASANGTLSLIAARAVSLTRGHVRFIPIAFFLMPAALAALGPGNISICALVLPVAMTVARDHRVSPLLMATMVIAGANAGGLSPIAPTGIIGVTLAREQGLDIGLQVFGKQLLGQSILAATLYFALRGHRLPRSDATESRPDPLDRKQWLTVGIFLAAVAAIVIGKRDIGLTAFSGAAILFLFRAADEKKVVASVPWSTLILVCGVGMLVNVSQEAGGIEIMSHGLGAFTGARTAGPMLAVLGGILSILSSASGVVMPTLIPAVPGLAEVTGADPARLVSAIIIGAHVVTNSPISTLGALAVAAATPDVDREALFRNLLLLALAGLLYAAALVYVGII